MIDRLFPNPAADRRALDWILAHRETDGNFTGAYYTTMVSLMALDAVPGGRYRPQVEQGLATLNSWLVTNQNQSWQQLALSTTWDTATALVSLQRAGAMPDDPAIVAGQDWLLGHQARMAGDWIYQMVRPVPPGGWYFGEAAEYFPDCDDTAVSLGCLLTARARSGEAFDRGLEWLLAMQYDNGGWAPWDRNNGDYFFFSFEAVAPSVANPADEDVTARILCLLSVIRNQERDTRARLSRSIERGLSFLARRRKADGSWSGHWYANHVYGTALVLCALVRCGVDPARADVQASVRWLKDRQNADGGFGEAKSSHSSGHFEPGPSDPVNTALAIQALLATGFSRDETVRRAVLHLVATQDPSGMWCDPVWNGIGISGQSWLQYTLTPTTTVVGVLVDILVDDAPFSFDHVLTAFRTASGFPWPG